MVRRVVAFLERRDLWFRYEDERYRVHLDQHGRVISVTDLWELRDRKGEKNKDAISTEEAV